MAEKIRVVPNSTLEPGPPTAGMVRSQAFATENVWAGEVRTSPGAISGWHHHGEHATYGYVVAGKVHFEFGPGGVDSAEGGSGDFFMVPPHTVHREDNPSSEEQVIALVRIGAGPTVINVDGPDPE